MDSVVVVCNMLLISVLLFHLSAIISSLDNFLKMVEVLNISLADLGINNKNTDSIEKEELIKIINTSSQSQIEAYLDVIRSVQKHIK